MLRFIAHLSLLNLSVSTSRVYLASLRAWFIALGYSEPSLYTPRVKLALKAMERSASPPRQSTPISILIRRQIASSLPLTGDNLMIWAAMLLAYFGCLRASEYCFNPDVAPPLSLSSFSFSSNPLTCSVRITSSKTSLLGFTATVGCTGTVVCPVCSIRRYISASRVGSEPPFFRFTDGAPLTPWRFNLALKSIISNLGLNPDRFSSHSLRAGSATDAAASGLPGVVIKNMGHWSSDAYSRYVRLPPQYYAALSKHLASSSH